MRQRRETYSRIIGCHFGDDANGNARIYDGAYYDPDTGKKQYTFIYVNRKGEIVSQSIMSYREFRAIIDGYQLP